MHRGEEDSEEEVLVCGGALSEDSPQRHAGNCLAAATATVSQRIRATASQRTGQPPRSGRGHRLAAHTDSTPNAATASHAATASQRPPPRSCTISVRPRLRVECRRRDAEHRKSHTLSSALRGNLRKVTPNNKVRALPFSFRDGRIDDRPVDDSSKRKIVDNWFCSEEGREWLAKRQKWSLMRPSGDLSTSI